jgi:isochorismate synthase
MLSPEVLLARLGADPSVATYAVPLPVELGLAGGATPELLLRKRGAAVVASAGRFRAAQCRCRRGRARGAGAAGLGQDHDEHRHVVEAIVEGLAPYCSHIDAQPRPVLHATASMWHLGTHPRHPEGSADVGRRTAGAASHAGGLRYAAAAALQRIRELEPVPRGFYAGAVGWLDAQGDGDWYVAIRCARLQGTQLRLYAGAGIVAESQPEAEVAETAAKFAALLNALGVHDAAPRSSLPHEHRHCFFPPATAAGLADAGGALSRRPVTGVARPSRVSCASVPNAMPMTSPWSPATCA